MDEKDRSLAAQLGAIASVTRLSILRALRSPRILAEIEVRAADRAGGDAIARQTVRRHLDELVAGGVVATRDVVRERGETIEFSVNHQSLYALSEEVRDLARLRPLVEPEGTTIPKGAVSRRKLATGPALVLVKGLEEGVTFDLRPDPPRHVEWHVGRRRGLEVSLDFDPYTSTVNSRIRWDGKNHTIESLPESRNGTLVNFSPLAPSEVHRLAHGDIIGIGRSTLVFWS